MADEGKTSGADGLSSAEEMPSVQCITKGNTDVNSGKATKSTKIPLLNLTHHLSRSHDNLMCTLKKKVTTPSSATPNQRNRLTPKANARPLTMPKLCKPISIQNIERSKSTPNFSARAQSVQNICRIPIPIRGSRTLVPKRSSSAQNMINSGGPRPVRFSSTVVAYNAELLSNFEKEKKQLEHRISELIQIAENRKAEVEKLKFELKKDNEMNELIQRLHAENQQLKNQLHELGITTAHFTDNDKILLLEHVSAEHRNSLDLSRDDIFSSIQAASEGTESLNLRRSTMGLSVGNLSSLTTQNNESSLSIDISSLDRQISLSVDRGLSDVGLAYLRDRIHQMQETHYSTNEELQATLQELADLQDSVNKLTFENEKLLDEKSILLESLCTQTEKLENARRHIEHLKVLWIQDSENNDRSENERQLMALIKSAQEEREELLLKQAEFNNVVEAFENENRELQDIISALRDRAELEESKGKVFLNDKKVLELQICDMKNQNITDQLEIAKYKVLLENERQKFMKSGSDSASENITKLEEMLTQTKKEKEELEQQINLVNEELNEIKLEMLKFKEQNSSLSDTLQVTRTNARMQAKKLESQLEEMEMEKGQLLQKMETLEVDLSQSQLKCKQAGEEFKTQTTKCQKLDAEHALSQKKISELNAALQEKAELFQKEQEEWLGFQKDLLLTVVVANDQKTETELKMESILTENQILKEKLSTVVKDLNATRLERDSLRLREPEISSLLSSSSSSSLPSSLPSSSSNSLATTNSDIRGKIISSVDRELAALRQGRLGGEGNKNTISNLLVKQLMASTGEQVKVDRASLRSPSPSLPSVDKYVKHENSNSPAPEMTAALLASKTEGSDVKISGWRRLSDVVTPLSSACISDESKNSFPDTNSEPETPADTPGDSPRKPLVGILSNKIPNRKANIFSSDNYDKIVSEKTISSSPITHSTKSDPLALLAKQLGGSKRNALLRWCQNKTASYSGIDITNFSSSWNDGLALCALLHTYLPDKIPFKDLNNQDKMKNFKCAFDAAESAGVISGPDLNVLMVTERPDWQAVFSYVTNIYKHFEADSKS